MNITNRLGGRGQCKKCGEYHNNVAFHESNCGSGPIHKFKPIPIPMPKVKSPLKKESPLISEDILDELEGIKQ